MNKFLIALLSSIAFSSAQAATTATVKLGADDSANLFISTSDVEEGAYFGTTSFFTGPIQPLTTDLMSGITNYLHILVINNGGPLTLAGEISLSNSGFAFADGSQFLSTQTTNVSFSLANFGTEYETALNYGAIINFGSNFSDQYTQPYLTQNIGSESGSYGYFSIPIYAVAAVPEPETYAMLIAGLGLMGFVARRKKE